MARKPKNYAGGRKVKPGEKQAEAHTGRDQNAADKKHFKAGAIARALIAMDAATAPALDRVGQMRVPTVGKARPHDDGNIGG